MEVEEEIPDGLSYAPKAEEGSEIPRRKRAWKPRPPAAAAAAASQDGEQSSKAGVKRKDSGAVAPRPKGKKEKHSPHSETVFLGKRPDFGSEAKTTKTTSDITKHFEVASHMSDRLPVYISSSGGSGSEDQEAYEMAAQQRAQERAAERARIAALKDAAAEEDIASSSLLTPEEFAAQQRALAEKSGKENKEAIQALALSELTEEKLAQRFPLKSFSLNEYLQGRKLVDTFYPEHQRSFKHRRWLAIIKEEKRLVIPPDFDAQDIYAPFSGTGTSAMVRLTRDQRLLFACECQFLAPTQYPEPAIGPPARRPYTLPMHPACNERPLEFIYYHKDSGCVLDRAVLRDKMAGPNHGCRGHDSRVYDRILSYLDASSAANLVGTGSAYLHHLLSDIPLLAFRRSPRTSAKQDPIPSVWFALPYLRDQLLPRIPEQTQYVSDEVMESLETKKDAESKALEARGRGQRAYGATLLKKAPIELSVEGEVQSARNWRTFLDYSQARKMMQRLDKGSFLTTAEWDQVLAWAKTYQAPLPGARNSFVSNVSRLHDTLLRSPVTPLALQTDMQIFFGLCLKWWRASFSVHSRPEEFGRMVLTFRDDPTMQYRVAVTPLPSRARRHIFTSMITPSKLALGDSSDASITSDLRQMADLFIECHRLLHQDPLPAPRRATVTPLDDYASKYIWATVTVLEHMHKAEAAKKPSAAGSLMRQSEVKWREKEFACLFVNWSEAQFKDSSHAPGRRIYIHMRGEEKKTHPLPAVVLLLDAKLVVARPEVGGERALAYLAAMTNRGMMLGHWATLLKVQAQQRWKKMTTPVLKGRGGGGGGKGRAK